MYIFIALITGGLVTVSMIINANLSKRVGLIQGTVINYIVGLIFSIFLLLFLRRVQLVSIMNTINTPKFYLLGGLLGVIVIILSNIVIPNIPVAYTTILIFLGQLVAGLLIDYIKLGVLTKGKIIGGILILISLAMDETINKTRE